MADLAGMIAHEAAKLAFAASPAPDLLADLFRPHIAPLVSGALQVLKDAGGGPGVARQF